MYQRQLRPSRPAECWRLQIKGRLRLWRYQLRITQRSMADAAGVSRSQVQRWEDARSPALPDLAQIAMVCDAARQAPAESIAWLLDGGQRDG